MAIIKTSALISSISGNLGGSTMQVNNAINILRSTPRRSATPSMSRVIQDHNITRAYSKIPRNYTSYLGILARDSAGVAVKYNEAVAFFTQSNRADLINSMTPLQLVSYLLAVQEVLELFANTTSPAPTLPTVLVGAGVGVGIAGTAVRVNITTPPDTFILGDLVIAQVTASFYNGNKRNSFINAFNILCNYNGVSLMTGQSPNGYAASTFKGGTYAAVRYIILAKQGFRMFPTITPWQVVPLP